MYAKKKSVNKASRIQGTSDIFQQPFLKGKNRKRICSLFGADQMLLSKVGKSKLLCSSLVSNFPFKDNGL